MDNYSYISNADVSFIENLHQQYLKDPESVDFGWKKFFEGFDFGQQRNGSANGQAAGAVSEDVLKEINVLNLIQGYRTRGHLFTQTNPVRERRKYSPTLEIANFGLNDSDLDTVFNAGVEIGIGPAKLRDIIEHLNTTYCKSIGAEYVYIRDPEKVAWLQEKMEGTQNIPKFSIEEKRHILSKLNKAVMFENFLHTKYVGQKRFSLEGAETLIPTLDSVIDYGADLGAEQFVIGMAHRGRLNVLANIFNKTYEEIFSEFEGKAYEDAVFEGDVKYHLGYSSDVTTSNGKKVHLSLSPNPSHLEAVNPVVEGIARAKINNTYNGEVDKVVPILLHGDASLAGQGIVYEVLQMSKLKGYAAGGTIHVAVNNQIGFTTNYIDGRSSTYCTDVAKVTLCPVFHVNGDDVEALVFAMRLAMEYRQKFNTDVFIDLLGYRKYGHNESDEPRFTQPVLYKAISKHPNPREIYNKKLLEAGSIEADLAKEMGQSFKQMLQEKLEDVRQGEKVDSELAVLGPWDEFRAPKEADFVKSPKTSVKKADFLKLADSITSYPEDFKALRKISKLFNDRKGMIEKDSYDWAMGELMAYATLLKEGYHVRISGQDSERGTFSHRHSVIKAEESDMEYVPLKHIGDDQARFSVYNSLLSEYAVMGFEYGYALSSPNALVIWEAQFGDFANGAQIIIDQFISSAEAKWKQHNGLVLLLPHGYEGQGPEHSSARLERFLQLCANQNMQVVNCSTPASFFHVLRRQMHREFRLPLVIMTPKSLLRHPQCVSAIKDFTQGGFKEVLDDTYVDTKSVKRVNFCSGKVYYDLLKKQQEDKRKDVAIVRLEQLYPMPEKQMDEIFAKYPNADYCWVQEEPKNMGAWTYMLRREENYKLKLIGRKASASPATGFASIHAREQQEIVDTAFNV